MNIRPLIQSLNQVIEILTLIDNLPEEQKKVFYMDTNAGKHVRHILDHFLCLQTGHKTGYLDYNIRNRDCKIETCILTAKHQTKRLIQEFETATYDDRKLYIASEVSLNCEDNIEIPSSFAREALYVLNHTLHHTAYIKLLAKSSNIDMPNHIGLAPATATYNRNR